MADLEDAIQHSGSSEIDMKMGGAEESEDSDIAGPTFNEEITNGAVCSGKIFIDYLRSPTVEILVGGGNGGDAKPTRLLAHEALLTQSPYFAERLASLSNLKTRTIELPEETSDAVGCFLQYQYTGEYFPRRLANVPDGIESDPSLPDVDHTGAQLLKHARVYTLAKKLGMPELKTLAHSKIHCINSTAVGEIAYARYVYGHSATDDSAIRKPVVVFWAKSSHVLRHEAERELKSMCLEYPQFGFDVLSLVLDQREKRAREYDGETAGKRRKRPRPSINV